MFSKEKNLSKIFKTRSEMEVIVIKKPNGFKNIISEINDKIISLINKDLLSFLKNSFITKGKNKNIEFKNVCKKIIKNIGIII